MSKGRVIATYPEPPKRELFGNPEELPDPRDAEIARLRTALEQIRDHCANAGRGNPAVDERIIERCEETAIATLTARVTG